MNGPVLQQLDRRPSRAAPRPPQGDGFMIVLPANTACQDRASMSRLSIIIPALNEAAGIAAALQALAPFRERGVEVIVGDGGSSDDTAERARPLADQVLIAPRGRAAQMNIGAAAASGGVLL